MRAPRDAGLARHVEWLWCGEVAHADREHVVARGQMHVAIRVEGAPATLCAPGHARWRLPPAVVSGAHGGYYAKHAAPGRTVGAQLRPGAARALFGLSAAALAGRHVPLAALWGDTADALRARLASVASPEARLDCLEQALLARLRPARGLHADVVQAMDLFDRTVDVGAALAQVGHSHRHFIALFRDATGLAPKRWARVRRFQRVLASLDAAPDWSAVAAAHGYCDQSHLVRDFHAFAGVAPRLYLGARTHANHVRIA